jgi:disulfide bond formation protein DsbB
MLERLTIGSRGPLLIAVASAAIVGSAIASQVWGGLLPCKLCLYQRVPYAFAILAGGAAAAVAGPRPRAAALITRLCLAAFVIGAGIAVYHVGVEQAWWESSSSCTGVPAGAAQTTDELRRLLETAPIIRCNEIQWSLFGVSMAGYNFFVSLGMAVFAGLSARSLAR